MPLIKSKSKKAIGRNIKTEMMHGKPKKQAIAIALNMARSMGADIPRKKVGKTMMVNIHYGKTKKSRGK